jgi:hypothetical protein
MASKRISNPDRVPARDAEVTSESLRIDIYRVGAAQPL